MSELLWVAVPGGVSAGAPLLRVLVDPRLDGGSLAEHGLERWPPPALADGVAAVMVEFSEDPERTSTSAIEVVPRFSVQARVWERLFGGGTVVEARDSRGAAAAAVAVDDTSSAADRIRATVVASAATPITGAAEARPRELEAFGNAVRAELAARWNAPQPPARRATGRRASGRPAPDDEGTHFHRTLSMLREHPGVLRALGLIFVLDLPASAALLAEGWVRVSWDAQPATIPDVVSPWTRFGERFLPASPPNTHTNISAGMVTLTDDAPAPAAAARRWDVVTVDVNGGAGRLREAARALADSPSSHVADVTLPALRTAGLQLVRRGREEEFAARLLAADANARLGSAGDAQLTADQLVLGYRIDIRPQGGEWHSLHRRRATFTVQGRGADGALLGEALVIGTPAAPDEGHVKPHATVDEGDGALRADEIVARWNGWSLSVPALTWEQRTGRSPRVRRAGGARAFHSEFAVEPRSLPQLRFGGTYDVRARVVDMAGGGLALDDPVADRCAIERVHYRRYEPVAPPAMTLPEGIAPAALGPAETVDHVVIRSDPATGIGTSDFALGDHQHAAHPVRVLHRPIVSLSVAEHHGVLDPVGDDPEADDRRTLELIDRALAAGSFLPDPAAGGVMVFARRIAGDLETPARDSSWDPWPSAATKLLELRWDGPLAGHPAVDWDGERLVVRLAPAEQITLELSSFLTAGILARFELVGVPGLPAVSATAAEEGRHPMITPVTAVTLVHAVRRPLSLPAGEMAQAPRQPGETYAVFNAARDLLGVDPKSTGQLELTASWTEYLDGATHAVVDAAVQTVAVRRADRALEAAFRHEFGDTRHRRVMYTLSAVSRFRQFFGADEPQAGFVAKTTFAKHVSVRSTAAPPPPVVLSARPALHWTGPTFLYLPGTVVRKRLGGRVRIELQRPWQQTGGGEMLAVVLWDGTSTEPPHPGVPDLGVQPRLTEVARDPIWGTTNIDRWPTGGHAASSAEPRKLQLREGGGVLAVPYAPWPYGKTWFADIALPGLALASYAPLARLALARYQPESIEGCELSHVVRTGMVPLLPERTLTVGLELVAGELPIVHTPTVARLRVTLDGPQPSGPRGNLLEAFLEQCVLPPGTPAGAAHNVELIADRRPADGISAWIPVPLASGAVDLATTNTVGLQIPANAGPLRLRVREVEQVGPAEALALGSGIGELRERVVFTDVVYLFEPPAISDPPGGE